MTCRWKQPQPYARDSAEDHRGLQYSMGSSKGRDQFSYILTSMPNGIIGVLRKWYGHSGDLSSVGLGKSTVVLLVWRQMSPWKRFNLRQGSYEHYKGVVAELEHSKPGFELQGAKMVETGLRFLNFFNDPRIIREQRIAAYKGYRGGGVLGGDVLKLHDES
ncbi:hypothetical protein Tco_1548021 [Tanacetum coccineum]